MKLKGILFASLALVAACVLGIGHESQFVFTPEVMHRVSKEALSGHPADADPKVVVDSVIAALRREYPEHIIQGETEWLFNNAGGAMGAMTVLHASLSEYVIIFGSPIGTEGHSGRFLSDDYFTILTGEQYAYSAGQLTKEVRDRARRPRARTALHPPPGAAPQLPAAESNVALHSPPASPPRKRNEPPLPHSLLQKPNEREGERASAFC